MTIQLQCAADGFHLQLLDEPVETTTLDPQQLIRRQQAVVVMGRRALAAPDRSILLHDAALLTAEVLSAEHYAFAELAEDGALLEVRLTLRHPERPEPRIVTQQVSASGEDSILGHVLQASHPIVIADLLHEKRFSGDPFRKYGIRSALAAPLNLFDRALGVLAVCSRDSDCFGTQDLAFAETIALLTATSVARRRAEHDLDEERTLSAGLFQTVDALLLVVDHEGQVIRCNRMCQQTTGFSSEELRSRTIWAVLPAGEAAQQCRVALEKARRGEPRVEFESDLLTKHGRQRRIRWICAVLPAKDGLDTTLLTGIDITPQREAEERASRAEQAAQQARKAAVDAERSEEAPGPSRASTGAGVALPGLGNLHRDRRRRPRRSYPYRQLVAPIYGGVMPARCMFHEVQCHDIAAGGFSYLSEKPPECDALVVGLGKGPRTTFLIAQIMHVRRIQIDGKTKYLVGCAYTGRAKY